MDGREKSLKQAHKQHSESQKTVIATLKLELKSKEKSLRTLNQKLDTETKKYERAESFGVQKSLEYERPKFS